MTSSMKVCRMFNNESGYDDDTSYSISISRNSDFDGRSQRKSFKRRSHDDTLSVIDDNNVSFPIIGDGFAVDAVVGVVFAEG